MAKTTLPTLEQGMRARPHFERLLLVVGMQGAGKSTALRSMYADPRFSTNGEPPASSRLPLVRLSRERCLHVRLTSPHERGETPEVFFEKIDTTMREAWRSYWRFNMACALQPHPTGATPGLADLCRMFRQHLQPERIRVALVHPAQGAVASPPVEDDLVEELWSLGVEVMAVSGRRSPHQRPNGLLLSSFFDFG